MEEIKIGEYCRTKFDGYIGKYVKDGLRKGTIEIEDKICGWIIDTYNITKHSPNLKDLVEVGDFVNGCIVDEDCRGLHIVTKDLEVFYLKDITIKSIATKEQFKEIEYEV